ncbi:MAG: nucleotide exchange factor GrpE [Leptospiraceae bacterium]|nr:nucleotide exchange factor GrpE [Leptospiraceae bacterium]MCP5496531.1 nucleotide exchange factor GrpE [Leptospiraceae bacterium]
MNKSKLEKSTFIIFITVSLVFFTIGITSQVFFFIWLQNTKYMNWEFQVISLVTLLIASVFLAFPFYLFWKKDILMDFPDALKSVSSEMANLELVRKEHYKTKTSYEELKNGLKKEVEVMVGVGDSLKESMSFYKGLENEVFNLRQTNIKLNKNLENWNRVSIEFIESVYRPLSYTEIDENYKLALNKVIKDFRGYVSAVGLDIIYPEVGSPFNDLIHEILETKETSELEPNSIVECKEPGYKTGENVLKRAKVIISKKNTFL